MVCILIQCWLPCSQVICKLKRAGCQDMPKAAVRLARSFRNKSPIRMIHGHSFSLLMVSTEMRINCAALFRTVLYHSLVDFPREICIQVTPTRSLAHKLELAR